MDWRDDGIIIGARRHGETSLILEVMTRGHGRHLGLVKGGRSRRMQPLLQPGNSGVITWRARLEENLGFFTVETTRLRAAQIMTSQVSLQCLNLIAGHLRLLAEREPHEGLFEQAEDILDGLDDIRSAPAQIVRFELALLAASGFGLDLASCAATGRRDDLIYVSPRSARAVCGDAGQPYGGRLLPLPSFLHNSDVVHVPLAEVRDGFALTGFFLARDLFSPRGLPLPEARDAYLRRSIVE